MHQKWYQDAQNQKFSWGSTPRPPRLWYPLNVQLRVAPMDCVNGCFHLPPPSPNKILNAALTAWLAWCLSPTKYDEDVAAIVYYSGLIIWSTLFIWHVQIANAIKERKEAEKTHARLIRMEEDENKFKEALQERRKIALQVSYCMRRQSQL